jgi:hypothetical protein
VAVPIVLFVLLGLLGWKTFGFLFKADMPHSCSIF